MKVYMSDLDFLTSLNWTQNILLGLYLWSRMCGWYMCFKHSSGEDLLSLTINVSSSDSKRSLLQLIQAASWGKRVKNLCLCLCWIINNSCENASWNYFPNSHFFWHDSLCSGMMLLTVRNKCDFKVSELREHKYSPTYKT